MEQKLDLRVEKTYLALHNAFTELLAERRFEELTVNELCQKAMIRRTTFYKHFADKYEYFGFYMQEISDEFHARLPFVRKERDVREYLMYMCEALLRFVRAHGPLVRNLINSSVVSLLVESLTEHIAKDALIYLYEIEGDSGKSSVELEGLAAFYAGGLVTVLRRFLNPDGTMDEEGCLQVINRVLAYIG